MRNLATVCAALLAVATIAGCTHPRADGRDKRAGIYERAAVFFEHVVLLKPAIRDPTGENLQLAPLVVQNVAGTNSPAELWRDKFAADLPGHGARTGNVLPRVFTWSETNVLGGLPREQLSFVWLYPKNPTAASSLPAQGFRMTLNAIGQPVIWEILDDTTGQRIIFVARSLEAAARTEFGPPEPGRRFAIERSVSEAPDTVVARVIEDGPMAAGPVVYLYAGTRNFATLICRCMNSQAKEVAAQDEYVLTRLNADSRVPRFPPGYRLSDWLRLPESF